MKKLISVIFVLSLICGFCDFAFAARRPSVAAAKGKGVCGSVVGIGGYIYKNYQPLRRGPHDHTLIGYLAAPTLLDNGGGSSRGGATIYDINGTRLGSCQGLPCDECNNHWRFKCSGSTSAIRRAALRNTRSASILFDVGGKCVQVPDAGKCNGSVKGLCNRTLQ